MKRAIFFTVTYHVLFFLLYALAFFQYQPVSGEMFSYMLVFQVFYAVFNLVVFILYAYIMRRIKTRFFKSAMAYFLIFFITLNLLPYLFGDAPVIMAGVVGELTGLPNEGGKLGLNNLGLLIISVVSFLLSFGLFRISRNWKGSVLNPDNALSESGY